MRLLGAILSRALDILIWLVLGILFLGGCGGALEQPATDCPAPAVVFASPELLETATTASTPDGCTCDAPLRPALTSSWPGGCSYTWEARCDGCAVDVTWRKP